MKKIKAAIIGPGNIGTDLYYKIRNRSKYLEVAMVMSRTMSPNLRRAAENGYPVTTDLNDILQDPEIKIVFDATMASAHTAIAPLLKEAGKVAIDLTPAAVGPYVCPSVNLGSHMDCSNINLITCGGQATIPMVAAVSQVCNVEYAEIVACIARDSAGAGTRESIDEFTITTAKGLEIVGGAKRAKAIIPDLHGASAHQRYRCPQPKPHHMPQHRPKATGSAQRSFHQAARSRRHGSDG